MRPFLPLLPLFLLPTLSYAQTRPDKTVPLESRTESRALVQKLLREGKIMAPGAAKRGMKGYALSVFQGTKIEKFDIEVLGVLERVQGGGDLVLIKVTSGPVVARQSGIIQGMSGSPVYINGKLLGAIAIGFGFPKEPIGGVTPITQMIATALPDNSPPQPTLKMARPNATEVFRPKTALKIGGKRIARLEVTRNSALGAFSGPDWGATMRMRPATQLLQLSGISQSSLPRWKAMLEPYGFSPVLGGGGMNPNQTFGMPSKKSGVSANLLPGAAIGVQLASGDIDATGVGTVTYRLGNRLLAFGHPMFGLGAVSMPMTTAYVHDLFPAYDISFKLASPIRSVGELQQDTNFAIGGTVGRRAQTVPLRISLLDSAKKIDKKFNVRLIKDPLFTPQLAQSITVDALQSTLGLDSDKMVRVAFSMGLKNGPLIRRVNTVYASDQVIAGAVSEMLDALSITQSNPFEKGAITSLDLRVEVIPGRKTAQIRRIYADRNRAKAGERVQISVVLEPTGHPDDQFTRRFTVQVPDDAPSGSLRIAASSAANFFGGRVRVGGEPPRPGNFRELLDAYSQIGADNELLLQTSTPRRFLMVDRKRVSNPPPTWTRLVPAGSSSSVGAFNETQIQRQNEDWVLSGLESIVLPVESNRNSDRARPDVPSGDDNSSSILSPSSDTPVAIDTSGDDDELFVSTLPTRKDWDDAPDFARRAQPLLRVLMQIPAPKPVPPTLPQPQIPPKTVVPGATPTPTLSATPTPTATPAPTPDASANTIARPAGRWIQKSSADFGRGVFNGTVVSSDGTLRVGPKNERLISSAEPVAWSIATDGKGTVYLGTGHNARLLKIQNGVSKVLYEGDEVAVSALALDEKGFLYAGVSPGGRVLQFAPDGTYKTILETGQTFVHALSFDATGNLIVATGGETAKIYRVEQPSQIRPVPALGDLPFISELFRSKGPKPLAILPQKHARSLALSGDSIYVGTGDEAVLYRIEKSGQVTALYQATGAISPDSGQSNSGNPGGGPTVVINIGGSPDPSAALSGNVPVSAGGDAGRAGNEILSLAVAGENVYFGTANSGSVFRWNAQKGVQELFKTPGRAVYALQLVGGELWAATGESGEVWRISNLDGDVSAARVLDATQPQVLALASAGNHVFAATGNNAAVYEIGGQGTDTFTSNVFDAGQIVRFGTLRALSSGASFEFRSGNTLEPDATWTAWKPVQNGDNTMLAPARYAQYRVNLSEKGSASRVEVAFRAPNRAPRVNFTLPGGGETFSGKKTLTWSASDPDKDTLRYKLELIGLDGQPQSVELTSTTSASQEIDTKKYADGTYTARIVASDASRNPEDPQSDSATSLSFTLDNTAPTLDIIAPVKNGDIWAAQTLGRDTLSILAGAEWRIAAKTGKDSVKEAGKDATKEAAKETAKDTKPGDWQAAGALDGLFDQKEEQIVLRFDGAPLTTPLKSGDSLDVRLRDAAGNFVIQTIKLP